MRQFLCMIILTLATQGLADGTLPLRNPVLQTGLNGGGHTISNVTVEGYLQASNPVLEGNLDGGGHTLSNVTVEGYLQASNPVLDGNLDGGGHTISNATIDGYLRSTNPVLEGDLDGGGHTIGNVTVDGYVSTNQVQVGTNSVVIVTGTNSYLRISDAGHLGGVSSNHFWHWIVGDDTGKVEVIFDRP